MSSSEETVKAPTLSSLSTPTKPNGVESEFRVQKRQNQSIPGALNRGFWGQSSDKLPSRKFRWVAQ